MKNFNYIRIDRNIFTLIKVTLYGVFAILISALIFFFSIKLHIGSASENIEKRIESISLINASFQKRLADNADISDSSFASRADLGRLPDSKHLENKPAISDDIAKGQSELSYLSLNMKVGIGALIFIIALVTALLLFIKNNTALLKHVNVYEEASVKS